LRRLTSEELYQVSAANLSCEQESHRKAWATAGMFLGGFTGAICATEICKDYIVLMLPAAVMGFYGGMVVGGRLLKESGVYIEQSIDWIISD
jgi:hypothetical protein